MLELREIYWNAPDGKEVLKNVNMTIDDGKFVVITGPNGSGKTTMAKIIMGVEKPTSGKIIFNGEDITDMDVTERAKRGISFAFQQPVRFKGITVQNILETSAGHSLEHEAICDIMQKVGLCAEDYIHRDIDSTLSGGEIKRIEIATILARDSKLTLFDEPEAGIDLWSFQKLIETFNEMHDNLRGPLIIISHQERILRIADEIILLADGNIKARGTSDEILEAEELQGKCRYRKEFFNE